MAGSTPLWRTHTTILLIVGFFVIIIALAVSYMVSAFRPTTEVRIGSGVYHLWVADTEASRIQGLSGVDKLDPNGGLLMAFPEDGLHGIWMKDMKVSLDIVWLDANMKVVHIVTNASPELSTSKTFAPKTLARYVIELPAGSVKNAGIKTGTVVEFTLNKEAQ